LESAHGPAELIARAPRMKRDALVIANVSGRGDKDMEILSRYL
jgi:tryptophan synthase beta chain